MENVLGYLTPLTFGTLTMLFHFCNSMIQYILEKKQSPSSINPYLHFSTYCAITRVCHLRMQNGAFCGSIFSASVRFVQCLCGL